MPDSEKGIYTRVVLKRLKCKKLPLFINKRDKKLV